jgi:hypothetical protein
MRPLAMLVWLPRLNYALALANGNTLKFMSSE